MSTDWAWPQEAGDVRRLGVATGCRRCPPTGHGHRRPAMSADWAWPQGAGGVRRLGVATGGRRCPLTGRGLRRPAVSANWAWPQGAGDVHRLGWPQGASDVHRLGMATGGRRCLPTGHGHRRPAMSADWAWPQGAGGVRRLGMATGGRRCPPTGRGHRVPAVSADWAWPQEAGAVRRLGVATGGGRCPPTGRGHGGPAVSVARSDVHGEQQHHGEEQGGNEAELCPRRRPAPSAPSAAVHFQHLDRLRLIQRGARVADSDVRRVDRIERSGADRQVRRRLPRARKRLGQHAQHVLVEVEQRAAALPEAALLRHDQLVVLLPRLVVPIAAALARPRLVAKRQAALRATALARAVRVDGRHEATARAARQRRGDRHARRLEARRRHRSPTLCGELPVITKSLRQAERAHARQCFARGVDLVCQHRLEMASTAKRHRAHVQHIVRNEPGLSSL